MNDQELHAYCEAWRQWCITRKYFIAPGTKNILGRMQPCNVGEPPNARLSEDLSYFNMAIHALVDMNERGAKCFVDFYFHRVKNIKSAAAEMGIGRNTFYDRKMRFARAALSMSVSLRNTYENSLPTPAEMAESTD
jgi:hypothetical protein